MTDKEQKIINYSFWCVFWMIFLFLLWFGIDFIIKAVEPKPSQTTTAPNSLFIVDDNGKEYSCRVVSDRFTCVRRKEDK